MNENDLDINALIKRYENMRYEGKSVYFDPDDFAVLAEYYDNFGDTDEAKHIAEIGLNMHPGSTQLMIVKAKMLVAEEKYQEAYDYLAIIGDDDGNVDYLQIKIECLLNLYMVDEADELVHKVLHTGGLDKMDKYTFLSEVGYLYNDVDLYNQSIFLLEEARKIQGKDLELLVDLSFAYEMSDNLKKSIEINNLLLDINPYSFEGWANLGKLHTMTKEYDKAIEAFDFALIIDEEVGLMKMKALTLYLNNNTEAANEVLKEALENNPDDESLYNSLLEGYEVMERYDEMLNVLGLKEERFGEDGIHLKRAKLYAAQGNHKEAEKLFNEIPEEEKDSFDYFVLQGELALYNGDFDTANASYSNALLENPDDEIVIDKLANINIHKNCYEDAAKYLELLIGINPDFPTAKARLAFICFETGEKKSFDEIMSQFEDDELRALSAILTAEGIDFSSFTRTDLLKYLNKAREDRTLFKNLKY